MVAWSENQVNVQGSGMRSHLRFCIHQAVFFFFPFFLLKVLENAIIFMLKPLTALNLDF